MAIRRSGRSGFRFAREAASRVGLPPPEALTVSRERARAAAAVLAFLDARPVVTALAAFDIILGLDGAGFVAAPAQVIVRESA